ncbi:hypothetical protein [Clostridium sp. DL1XJH146]
MSEEKYGVKEFARDLGLFFKGATDYNRKSSAMLEKEAHTIMDNFILLCNADLLGLPIPTTYYTLEILPYIADDLEHWQKRMMDRKEIWMEKFGDFDLDA